MSIILLSGARREFDEAIEWYNTERQGLGLEFRDEVLRVLSVIDENPARCGWYDEIIRRCVTDRFPYLILYYPQQPRVVIAISHTSRRPDHWRGRLN